MGKGNLMWLIPTDRMTLMDQARYKQTAAIAGVQTAMDLSLNGASVADVAAVKAGLAPDVLDIREAQPILDFGAAIDQWFSAVLAAIGGTYSVFGAATPTATMANNRIAVFYKVNVEAVPWSVTRLQFRNAGIAGNLMAVYDLEFLATQDTPEGYFSQPVVFKPSQIFAAQVLARIITGAGARVQLGCLIIEPKGTVVA